MRSALTATFAVLHQGESTFIVSLFFELFVVLVVLSNVVEITTDFALQTHRLAWTFFLFCHMQCLNSREVVYTTVAIFARPEVNPLL